MRWMRFEHQGSVGVGRVENDRVQPVAAEDLQTVMRGEGTKSIGDPVAQEEVRVLAPVSPSKVIAVGQNYLDHVKEQGGEPPDEPVLFANFPTSVIGHGDEIRWPDSLTQKVDYEAELAVVIGRRAKSVSEEVALNYVFGYTACNEVSARDLQMSDSQWTRGKALDTFCPVGPIVVEKDEVPDPQDLSVECRLNGETMQDSNTSEMLFTVAQLIAYITEGITLEPGDVVVTGTPPGVGIFRTPPVFLKPGDIVEVEIGGVCTLSNPVGEYF